MGHLLATIHGVWTEESDMAPGENIACKSGTSLKQTDRHSSSVRTIDLSRIIQEKLEMFCLGSHHPPPNRGHSHFQANRAPTKNSQTHV